jgi:hypothetical protein
MVEMEEVLPAVLGRSICLCLLFRREHPWRYGVISVARLYRLDLIMAYSGMDDCKRGDGRLIDEHERW